MTSLEGRLNHVLMAADLPMKVTGGSHYCPLVCSVKLAAGSAWFLLARWQGEDVACHGAVGSAGSGDGSPMVTWARHPPISTP